MHLSQHIEQRQVLHLTTELRQGISILQMSATELAEHVNPEESVVTVEVPEEDGPEPAADTTAAPADAAAPAADATAAKA